MVARTRMDEPGTQGHIAVYAKDARRRQALARTLSAADHSHHEAATPDELHRLLDHQQFDVAALIVRDSEEAEALAAALDDVQLPLHTILVGSASALPLTLKRRRGSTFRFVPGQLTAREIIHLVDSSISAGMWDEAATDNGNGSHLEQVELEEIIERAAAAVYSEAKRKRQRFNTVVSGTHGYVLGNPTKLRHIFSVLLRLFVSLAPTGVTVSIDAHGNDKWVIDIRTSDGKASRRPVADIAAELREERAALTAVAREVRRQGGMLWVELAGPAAPALCLTLPLPAEAFESASA